MEVPHKGIEDRKQVQSIFTQGIPLTDTKLLEILIYNNDTSLNVKGSRWWIAYISEVEGELHIFLAVD